MKQIPGEFPGERPWACYALFIMKFILALTAFFLLSVGAQAQTVVLEDDFNDASTNPMWTLTYDQLAFWTVFEVGNSFGFFSLSTPFGANDERYTLTADVPGGLPGTFQLDAGIDWDDQSGSSSGAEYMTFVVRVFDAGGTDIATFRLDDRSTNNGGDLSVFGNTAANFGNAPADSGCDVSLWRDSSNTVHYSLSLDGGGTATGSLGVVVGTVDKVEFYASHTTSGGPGGPAFGQLLMDYIRIWDGPTSSVITLATTGMTAGAPATFDMTQATPGGQVFLAYSLVGNGPTSTPYGLADLSAPIQNFSPVTADGAGNATVGINVPGGAAGVTVWFQALDQVAGELSNGLTETVL